eukprot:GEMP01025627.1.p1 GENE.GEMP01025627.1~~GEMP01025627.1.p1  ORF type:complete len:365 (+),score=32.61 GEMP01025627.1:73-1167(+)
MRRLSLSDFRCFKGQHSWDVAGGSNDRTVWCINGANGTGKSTICDALRYLLDRENQGNLDDITEGEESLQVSALIMGQEIEKTLRPIEKNGQKVPKSTYRLDGRPTAYPAEGDIPSAYHIAQFQLSEIQHPSEIDLPAPMACAELSNGRLVVFQNDVVFGRHKSCDVLVESICVSTRHCRVKRPREPNAVWQLHDFGSTNGTCINGKRLKISAPINSGDVIRFGDMFMTFKETNPRRDVSIIFQELMREPTDAQMTSFFPCKANTSLTWVKDKLVVTIDGIKRPMSIFSPGEKALVYLSMLLARHHARRSTFCLLDEVDAKLDPKRRMALRYFLKFHPKAPKYTLMVSHTLGAQKKDIRVSVCE